MSFLESAPVTTKDLLVVREGLETKIAEKQDTLSTADGTLDVTPQAGSTKPVTSGGVHSSLDGMISEPTDFPMGDTNDRILLINAATKATSLLQPVKSRIFQASPVESKPSCLKGYHKAI